MKGLKKKLKEHFQAVLQTKSSCHSIALGASIGTLIGTLPIPIFDFFIALFIVFLFKDISKYSLFASVLFWNPLTKIPIYSASYMLGDYIFGPQPIVSIELSFINKVIYFSRRFIIGNLIISIGLTIGMYLFVYSLVYLIKKFNHTIDTK